MMRLLASVLLLASAHAAVIGIDFGARFVKARRAPPHVALPPPRARSVIRKPPLCVSCAGRDHPAR
jgi:hypothetical protein